MLKKLKHILYKKDYNQFKFVLLLNSLMFFLEFVTIASVPLFVTSILNPEIVIIKLQGVLNFEIIEFLKQNLVIFSSTLVVVSFLIKNIILVLILVYQGNFFRKFKLNLSKKLFNFYTDASFLHHLNRNPSNLSRNVTDEINGVYNYLLQLTQLVRESVAILVIFLLILIVNPLTAISICFFLSLISVANIKKVKPYLKSKAANNQTVRKNMIQTIYETFGSIKDIKIFGKEKNVKNFFESNANEYERNVYHFAIFSRLPRILLEVFTIIGIIILSFFYLTILKNSGNLFPVLSLLAISAMRFIPAFNSVVQAVYFLKIYNQSIRLITEELKFIDAQISIESKNKIEVCIDKSENKSLFFVENLSYKYPGRENFQLKNINIEIKKGKKIAITGKTGSGKSTLFYLMLGLIKPSTGNIFINGENMHLNLQKWRQKIGYISQNIHLLDGSIKKNIAFEFLDQPVNEKLMKEAISISCLNQKVAKLKEGYNTEVGSDGLMFSGGERQRIAIARAVYKKPEIFFLDEFTSALDTKTEDEIIKNFDKKLSHCTLIMIAHRKETINKCDEVWELNNGELRKL